MSDGDAPGYRSADYAAAVAASGRPIALGATGGHLIERPIPGTELTDLTGPYPLLCCTDWTHLPDAVSALAGPHVSLTLVTDPFCPLPLDTLSRLFPLCRPLHDHYLIDVNAPLVLSRGHRRALRKPCPAQITATPAGIADLADWMQLYAVLVARKQITDRRAFDADSFRRQLTVPGAWLVTARDGDRLLGADLYYVDGPVAYAHLSAYSDAGYALAISYPMMAFAVAHFAGKVGWINLGGAPAQGGEGVRSFKQGWTTLTRPSHLCGRILDPASYAALAAGIDTDFFPAYRSTEFRR